jgi:hypothetical protein
MMRKPLGDNPWQMYPWTPGPGGINDTGSPFSGLPGPTPGPWGINDGSPGCILGMSHGLKLPFPQPAPAAADAKPVSDPDIEALNLSDTARKAAYELKKKKPSAVFTSGRRDKDEQASAMAANVTQDRDWIKNTYAKSAARDGCQKWVDDNKDKKTQAEITTGLKGVLDSLTDAQLGELTRHLSGNAFDVQPVSPDTGDIKKAIKGLTGIKKFLEKEGKLVRWHAEF